MNDSHLQIKFCRCLKGKKLDRLIGRLAEQLLHILSTVLGSIIKSETKNSFVYAQV